MPKMGLLPKADRDTQSAYLEKLAKRIDTLAAKPGIDAATFKRTLKLEADTLLAWYETFDQSGNGANKRFSGAESHEFADQLAAFSATVRAKKVPIAS